MNSFRFWMMLFLFSSVLFGCASSDNTNSSKLPWARPADWDSGRQVEQDDGHSDASYQFRSKH